MNNNSNNNYEDEIDFSFLFTTIWNSKLTILLTTILFGICSIFYALSIPDKFTSSALLQVQSSNANSSRSGLTSQLGGLASLAGISMPSGGGDKSFYAIETIKSREFLKHLVTFEGVKENLIAANGYDYKSNSTTFDEDIYDSNIKKWVREETRDTKIIPTYLEIYDYEYNQNLLITKDKKSGYLTVSYEHYSPQFAYDFLNLIINEVNSVAKKKDLEESQIALDYLTDKSKTIAQKNIKDSFQNLLDSQLERLMLANIKDDYLVAAVDSPFIAEQNSSPTRPLLVIIITFFGFLSSIFYVLFNSHLHYSKK
jgi:uncharacterized protein involved in exopolysaccharide biosynthesis|tara:strand:- start:104 stop:1039 length:936 start_codon:yes stop_codon:yes gene_type:complete